MIFTKISSLLKKLHPRMVSFNGITFHPHKQTELCQIMSQCGSDKGSWHNYTTLYYPLLAPRRKESLRIFELGLGTNNEDVSSNMGANGVPGASLRGWKQFFPNASIFGADIDARILFEEIRIKTFHCDQTDPQSIQKLWAHPELTENFDIIIEDGLHEFSANKCFFENSVHKLRKHGCFIVEDLDEDSLSKYEDLIRAWRRSHPQLRIDLVKIPSLIRVTNLVLVARKLSM